MLDVVIYFASRFYSFIGLGEAILVQLLGGQELNSEQCGIA